MKKLITMSGPFGSFEGKLTVDLRASGWEINSFINEKVYMRAIVNLREEGMVLDALLNREKQVRRCMERMVNTPSARSFEETLRDNGYV